jgi:uncharacterized paraquat-inducible protein A
MITDTEHNMKSTEVYCPNCKMYTMSSRLMPHCEFCGTKLYAVIRSMITGKRITGNDELALRFNESA